MSFVFVCVCIRRYKRPSQNTSFFFFLWKCEREKRRGGGGRKRGHENVR